MLASWIVATHFRPRLLRACLQSIVANTYPPHWRHEVIVAHHEADASARAIAQECGATPVSCKGPTGGAKRNAALAIAAGELVLVADDDDCHSPARAGVAIAAYEAGYAISEVCEYRFLHLASGNVVRWCGRPTASRPGVTVGTARNYRRSLLQRVGGWKSLPRLIEKDLHARIASRLPGRSSRAHELVGISDNTVCVQHDANIWNDRPEVPRGKQVERGDYLLIGEGHWTAAPNFPVAVAERLGL